ncbi:Protein rogdi [Fragariocoptes setiger]|uniref:Protein rogdi n=1 Tax=Fragariocoptes setiger TaxID=1670756 RepID=A0ABQ7SAU0_9ACAR|nr:Protein rogdi [Fragariocoptes setiger]
MDSTNAEIASLQAEFEWLLNEEVGVILNQLNNILFECCRRFPCQKYLPNITDNLVQSEKYTMSYTSPNQHDFAKIKATIHGDKITYADITIRLSKHPTQTIKTSINATPDGSGGWILYQIQDSMNHLIKAIDLLASPPLRMGNSNKYDFKSAEEIIQLTNSVMNRLQRSRNSLVVPIKRTIEDSQASHNMQSINPALPLDVTISFYIQAHNIVCSVYQLTKHPQQGIQIKQELKSEASIPILSEVLVFLSLGLQCCQQLKDKVNIFAQYNDLRSSESRIKV